MGGNIAPYRRNRNTRMHRVSVLNAQKEDRLEDLGTDGRTIL